MKILVIGSGGREHALAWSFARSEKVTKVIVANGNGGTASEKKVSNINIDPEDITALINLAKAEEIDLTVVGPEAPLVKGIVDQFNNLGMRCFGPTALGARLEGSKTYTKKFLERFNIATASYKHFSNVEEAINYGQKCNLPAVVKADGLAAGKGVIITNTRKEVLDAIKLMMSDQAFGSAGEKIIIEDFLEGEEASFMAIVDGTNILPLATSQDHKARDDGDKGPNTGGMGAYSPAPIIDDSIAEVIMSDIMQPTIDGLRQEGEEYIGFLYAGLMIGADRIPRVLEFNCRMGDPETQPILFRLKTDLVDLIEAALNKTLHRQNCEWDPRPSLGVVLAADGYPNKYHKGDNITGLNCDNESDNLKIFHAGTRIHNNQILTNGGRVLCCVALGDTLKEAKDRAYDLANKVDWKNKYFRKDIGYKAIT
ncbi:MAG: phosphoribosylamine--glycine ligase [Pseudomonadota bacterium]|nr:phosphoribosylamine--glycine ligase [Pseudomonadota bacterium]